MGFWITNTGELMKKSTLFGLFILSDTIAIALFAFALIQNPESGDLLSNPIFFVALGLFIVVPTVLVIIYSQNPAAGDAELLRTGEPAYATVLDVWDIHPGSTRGKAQVGLKLQVNPANETSYETKTTALVASLDPPPYRAGMVLKVRYHPRHPKRVVIDDGGASGAPETAAAVEPDIVKIKLPQEFENLIGQQNQPEAFKNTTSFQINANDMGNLPPALQKLIQNALVDADHNGIPDVIEKGGMNSGNVQVVDLSGRLGGKADPQARIAKLEKLRAAGLINQEMFDLLKSKIEKGAASDPGSGNDAGRQ
jgi:hypothetical protein